MIFGIDFGTTYTVVSWFDKQLNFLNRNSALLPTEFDEKKHIKLLLANNDEDAYLLACKFFGYINSLLEQDGFVGIKDCILTIPARFDDLARNAIKAAAIWAGFNVLKLIAEPVAAAIYCVKEKQNGYYMVYDLGGGTFDTTLLKFQDGVFHILAIDGLKNFGGINIDSIIAQHKNLDLNAACDYKEAGDFDTTVYKAIESNLQPTYEILFKLLKENSLGVQDINEVILAGGSTKLPMIYEYLSKSFEVTQSDEPSLVVSAGAAMHAVMLDSDEHMLIDVTPFNLGIEILGETMAVVIPKNSPIPFSAQQYFKPVNKESVIINVLQGISERVQDCISLAKFEISTDKEFMVNFMIDCDGIVAVKVLDEVFILSKLQNQQFKNQEFETFYTKVMEVAAHVKLNAEQEKFMQYIKQAREIGISQNALKWLEEQYEQLF